MLALNCDTRKPE